MQRFHQKGDSSHAKRKHTEYDLTSQHASRREARICTLGSSYTVPSSTKRAAQPVPQLRPRRRESTLRDTISFPDAKRLDATFAVSGKPARLIGAIKSVVGAAISEDTIDRARKTQLPPTQTCDEPGWRRGVTRNTPPENATVGSRASSSGTIRLHRVAKDQAGDLATITPAISDQ